MDMREFASKYIKPDHVRDGPIQSRVVSVFKDERYGRPTLELENGSLFGLNDGNFNTLMKAWGHNSYDWISQELILELGTYKDWKSDPPEEKETVKARAISPAKTAVQNGGAPASRPLPPSRVVTPPASKNDDMNDDIPF